VDSGGHPKPEWGDDDTWRSYYLKECRRRGLQLLEQLGWPKNNTAKYVHLHARNVETLWEIATACRVFTDNHTVADQVWSAIEHWEPHEQGKPSPNQILARSDRSRQMVLDQKFLPVIPIKLTKSRKSLDF
jgi:hypothetical protein